MLSLVVSLMRENRSSQSCRDPRHSQMMKALPSGCYGLPASRLAVVLLAPLTPSQFILKALRRPAGE